MNLIKKFNSIIENPEVDFEERMFLMLTTLSEFALLIAICNDIILGEHLAEIIMNVFSFIMNPLIKIKR